MNTGTSFVRVLALACMMWSVGACSRRAPAEGAHAPTQVERITRGPYLQNATQQSMVVRWRTAEPCVGSVRFGTDLDQLDHQVVETVATTEHEVLLTGLQPATNYHYCVQSGDQVLAGGDGNHTFRTNPVPGTATPARIWITGDAGTGDANQRAVYEAYQRVTGDRHTDVFLQLGDNAYERGTDAEYQRAMFDMYPELLRRTCTWSTVGNHEVDYGHGAVFYSIYTLPTRGEAGGVASGTESYWSFDYGRIHIINLCSSGDTDLTAQGAMHTWLEQDLIAARGRVDWILVMFHHPPYTHGSHNSDTEARHIAMREHFVPLLEAYGVDAVFGGHSHSYERSVLMRGHLGRSDSWDPVLHAVNLGDGAPDGDGPYRRPDDQAAGGGMVFTVAGSSGKVSGMSGAPLPFMHRTMRTLGSVILTIDGDTMDVEFLNAQGCVQDRYRIEHVQPASDSHGN